MKYNASRDQIPVRLAYACTIHKAQGQTILKCVIDLGENNLNSWSDINVK